MDRVPFLATPAASPYEAFRRLPVSILLDNVRSMYNVGAFFRTGDAAAIETLYLAGITAFPPKRGIAKTALGAEERVRWVHGWSATALLEQARAAGNEIAAIETSVHSVDLFDWQPRFPVCLLFGNEVDGLQSDLVERADTRVRIPMLGLKHSLNVATAGGIVVYELLRKYRSLHGSSAAIPPAAA